MAQIGRTSSHFGRASAPRETLYNFSAPQRAIWNRLGDLRPITLLALTQKLVLRILLRLMRPWASPVELWTMGFRAGYQPSELTRSVMGLVENREWKLEVQLVKTDLTNTYDEVTLQNVWAALARWGTPTSLVKMYLRCVVESRCGPAPQA